MTQSRADFTAHDRPGIAIATILFTSLALSFGDALVKFVSADLVVWQIFVLRSVIAIPVLIAICRMRIEPIQLIPIDIGWTVLRSLLMILMWLVYYVSLLNLPISVAASVYYTMPIFVTLLAAIFIGDKVGIYGWFGVGIGFIGVLLIIKPGSSDFSVHTLLPLIAAFLFALAMIITRTKCRNEHPYVLALNINIAFLLTGFLGTVVIHSLGGIEGTSVASFFGGPWQSMGSGEWAAIAVLALAIIIASVGVSFAYQVGRSSVVATFIFSYVIFFVSFSQHLLYEKKKRYCKPQP
jgi:drug/metabolite transporter (DMT)-like permease